MSRVIEVAFAGDPSAVVAKARGAAERHGAEFSGDHVAGRFAGNGIEGHYRFGDHIVVVTIEKKPDFAPWPLVERAIRGFFELEPGEVAVTTNAAPASEAAGASDAAIANDRAKRRARADAIIRKHVLWSSGAGLIPIPLADIAAVTAVQVDMLRDLTKLYGAQASEPVLQSFVTALTGGMIARLGASAIKAIPGIGTFLGLASMSVMSGASTYAVGQVARRHLETSGQLAKVDLAKARREYGEAYKRGKHYVEHLQEEQDPDVISKLERLGELRARGVLTEDEFQAEKAKLLGKS